MKKTTRKATKAKAAVKRPKNKPKVATGVRAKAARRTVTCWSFCTTVSERVYSTEMIEQLVRAVGRTKT